MLHSFVIITKPKDQKKAAHGPDEALAQQRKNLKDIQLNNNNSFAQRIQFCNKDTADNFSVRYCF